jgi:hypothetical protein
MEILSWFGDTRHCNILDIRLCLQLFIIMIELQQSFIELFYLITPLEGLFFVLFERT